MRIGVNLLLWATHVTRAHASAIEAVREAGADGVEVPIFEGGVEVYRDLGRLLDDLGLQRTAAMAFVTPDENPASPDVARRQAAADALRHKIECARAVGATVLCGPMFQTLGEFTGRGPTDDERARAAEVVRSTADLAAQAGVTLAVEPLNRFECHLLNTVADGAAFVDRVGHPAVGMLFDTFHAHIEEVDPPGAIRRYARVIRHVHCSANHRGIPGRDQVDWAGTFAALRGAGYDGWLTIEAFGRALPGLAAATKIWRDLFVDANDVARVGVPFVRGTWQRAGG
jgi:D-psicose/D-tagatose/L-ribulose 3-epimerase